MNEIILSFLGPYAGWLMALSLGLVSLKRRSIRKRHVLVLLALTVLAFVSFFVLLVLGMARWNAHPALVRGVLFVVGAITVGCGSAIGFWLVLKAVGLVPDEDGDGAVDTGTRTRR